MSELGRPFLPPDLRQLIEVDRRAPAPPAAVKRDVAMRIDRSLGFGGAMVAPGFETPSIESSPPSIPPPPPATIFGWKLVSGIAMAIVVGGAALLAASNRSTQPAVGSRVGAVVAALPVAPRAQDALAAVDVDSQYPRAAAGADAVQTIVPGAATRVAGSARSAARHHATSVRAPSSVDSLAAERTILDGARSALSHHDASAALSALRNHERSFPRGQLLEERESMRVQALALSHDAAAAHAAGEKFRRHFPRSMFLPAVEQALATAP